MLIQRVLEELELKAQHLGFNAQELLELAKVISDNIDSQDITSEKESQIVKERVNMLMPALGLGQKQAHRLLERYKRHSKNVEPPVDCIPDLTEINLQMRELKTLLAQQKASTEAMAQQIAERLAKERLEKIMSAVENKGEYGNMILSIFNRMNFTNDDDFEKFLKDIKNYEERPKQQQETQKVPDVADDSIEGDALIQAMADDKITSPKLKTAKELHEPSEEEVEKALFDDNFIVEMCK